MGEVILITGGARAGKSRFALGLARAVPPPRRFVATADPGLSAADPEMARRVAAHRAERGLDFETVEAPVGAAAALRDAARAAARAVVLDDLTLWVANRLAGGDASAATPRAGAALAAEVEDLAEALGEARGAGAVVVVVTNEVGSGVVPTSALARAYVDALGWANVRVAAAADAVWLLVAGVPLRLR